jgi:aspartate/methionine/tyrosine aminotransferase
MKPASRIQGIDFSLIRQINALATPLSVNLGIGEPNLVPDETFREMARAAATSDWRYTANAGAPEVRKRIIEAKAPSMDWRSEICITAGTEEGMYALAQSWIDEGDEVLVPNPGFQAYATLVKLAGGKSVYYDLDPDGWRVDVEEIERKITKRTRMIVVISPSNPLGSVVDENTLDRIAQLADERDLIVISDEIYNQLYYGSPPPSMLGRGRNTIVVDGLSKSHGMTGLRLGWLLAREELMAPIVRAHQYVATCASVFSQSLAGRIFANEEWNRSWLARAREQFGRQREVALSAIERELDARIPPPQGAFYAFVPVPFCETVPFAKALAIDAAVLAIPGVAFGPAGEGFLRISFAASLDQIGTGIERIGRYMRGLAR